MTRKDAYAPGDGREKGATAAGLAARLPFMKKRIAGVVNANAGNGMNRSALRDRIVGMLTEAFDVRQSAASLKLYHTRTLDELADAKEAIKQDPPDILVSFGGDGTTHRLLGDDEDFLACLQSHWRPPDIVIIPLGTMNTVPEALQLYGRNPEKSVATMIEKIKRGVPLDCIHRPILRINGKYGFIYGSGLTANFLKRYYAKSPRGPWRAVKTCLATFGGELIRLLPFLRRRPSVVEPFQASWELWSDDRLMSSGEGQRRGVIAASVEQVGMNCRVTHRAFERIGHFHVVLSNLSFWQMLPNLWPMFVGLKMMGDIQDEVVTKAVIRYDRPVSHMIDGEIYGPDVLGDQVTMEAGQLLRFVRS